MIKCVAIDDEPPALDIIENFCRRIGNVELQKFSNPTKGLEEIRRNPPDIVFLDIEMDGINGIDIASRLPENTCFIFTTAYLKYALEGFDLDAVDYLHKPFSFSRFQVAFTKALRRIGRQPIQTTSQCIVVKRDYNSVSIPIDDILYIEAVEGYSKIFRTSGECVMSRILLKIYLQCCLPRLSSESIARISSRNPKSRVSTNRKSPSTTALFCLWDASTHRKSVV